jgi:hypothetical protein
MPNVRAPGQKLLNFPAYEDFIKQIDEGVAKSGAGDRAKFVRQAIVEHLENIGIHVPAHLAAPPPRTGKKYPSGSSGSYLLNDAERKKFKRQQAEALATARGTKFKKKKP